MKEKWIIIIGVFCCLFILSVSGQSAEVKNSGGSLSRMKKCGTLSKSVRLMPTSTITSVVPMFILRQFWG